MSKAKKKVTLMPAIREESNLRTSRIPVHIIPPGSKAPGPLKQSMIIQNLPDEPRPRLGRPLYKNGGPAPGGPQGAAVDQLVASYLNYGQQGPPPPPWPLSVGFAPPPCPCCQDRNRENLHRLQDRHRAPAPEPAPDEALPEPEDVGTAKPPNPGGLSPKRTHNNVGFSDTVSARQITPRDAPARFSWPGYQPRPYLAPHGQRLSWLSWAGDPDESHRQREDAQRSFVSGQVLDANSKYELAMKRLKRTLHRLDSASVASKQEAAEYL